jgi:heme ABC exporter ATP-binding subunit CcmA
MIRTQGLTKIFPTPDGVEKIAVNNVSFQVRPGEIYGLLGPNGAGKTTSLRMISGLLRPTSGSVFINGQDVTDNLDLVKRSVGYLTANTGLYERLTPVEMLRYFATLYDIEESAARQRTGELIDWLDIEPFKNLRCGSLSTGQKQRVNIARALIADPPIMIMDEPTLGLDVLSNRLMLSLIKTQAEAGKAVLLSTHALDEIETMCQSIGLIHHGRLIAEGSLSALREKSGKQRLSDIFLRLTETDEPRITH